MAPGISRGARRRPLHARVGRRGAAATREEVVAAPVEDRVPQCEHHVPATQHAPGNHHLVLDGHVERERAAPAPIDPGFQFVRPRADVQPRDVAFGEQSDLRPFEQDAVLPKLVRIPLVPSHGERRRVRLRPGKCPVPEVPCENPPLLPPWVAQGRRRWRAAQRRSQRVSGIPARPATKQRAIARASLCQERSERGTCGL